MLFLFISEFVVMKQIDEIVNKCRTAIHAGMPILYIESDDIGIIDDILHTQKLTEYWHFNFEGDLPEWFRFKEKAVDTGTRPTNIFVTNQKLPATFFWIGNSQRQNKAFGRADSTFVVKGLKPLIKNDRSVRYILGVRNFSCDASAENALINHVSSVINSNEDDDIRKCVIILQSSSVQIPKGLEPYVELIEVPKLKDDEICEIIVDFAKDRGEVQPLIVNLRGFNTRKIKDILNRLYLHCQGLFTIKCEEEGIKLIRTVKEQMLKKEGLLKLKYVDKNTYVSGLDQLTEWLVDRAELFRDPIKAETQWNLSTPKGILVSGVPGTGKSALANQIAMVFDLPILQFDMGSVLGKYSGESEANMRKVLKLAESMSPCVLWIDEIEKAFSSASSSGDSDGGQGKRLFGQFLTWMQEKKEACFIFATANDISALPPEFLRRGRFDRKFYTFMPSKQDCIEIFKGIISRFNGKSKPFDELIRDTSRLEEYLTALLKFCGEHGKFMTGADIEGMVKDAMFSYYRKYWYGHTDRPGNYIPEKFMEELQKAVLNVRTYGETDMRRVVECLFRLAENQFSPASASGNLLSLKDVNVRDFSIGEFKGEKNGYDELLHDKIKAETDYIRSSGQKHK